MQKFMPMFMNELKRGKQLYELVLSAEIMRTYARDSQRPSQCYLMYINLESSSYSLLNQTAGCPAITQNGKFQYCTNIITSKSLSLPDFVFVLLLPIRYKHLHLLTYKDNSLENVLSFDFAYSDLCPICYWMSLACFLFSHCGLQSLIYIYLWELMASLSLEISFGQDILCLMC